MGWRVAFAASSQKPGGFVSPRMAVMPSHKCLGAIKAASSLQTPHEHLKRSMSHAQNENEEQR